MLFRTSYLTKRDVVHEELRLLILLNEQAEVRTLRGKLPWDGNLDDQRQSRVKVRSHVYYRRQCLDRLFQRR